MIENETETDRKRASNGNKGGDIKPVIAEDAAKDNSFHSKACVMFNPRGLKLYHTHKDRT